MRQTDWVYGIQRAIDYMEAHITEKIDYKEVAKQACSSAFHFGRVFGILCGYTLGDYVRMRRLTLAAEQIIHTDRKIIDIAFDHGYDTPESFSRAFSKFHGYTPTEVRNGMPITSFSRLSVKIVLSGGKITSYRIEKNGTLQAVEVESEEKKKII